MQIGKALSSFANKIGKGMDYNSLRQLGGSIAKTVGSGLHEAGNIGGQVSGILGKAREVADGLRGTPLIGGVASLVGGGLSQAKTILDFGRKGVSGLEKVAKHAADVGNTVDSHHKLIGSSVMSGNTGNLISVAKDIAAAANKNPFTTK